MNEPKTSPGLGAPPPGWTPPMADISWVRRKYLDIPYAGQSPNQRLDIYLPQEGEGPFPLLIHVHGGGFAGTIQAFVPLDMKESFRSAVESVLGEGSCHILSIRPDGGTVLAG